MHEAQGLNKSEDLTQILLLRSLYRGVGTVKCTEIYLTLLLDLEGHTVELQFELRHCHIELRGQFCQFQNIELFRYA